MGRDNLEAKVEDRKGIPTANLKELFSYEVKGKVKIFRDKEGTSFFWRLLNKTARKENWMLHEINYELQKEGLIIRVASKPKYSKSELVYVENPIGGYEYFIITPNNQSNYVFTRWIDGNGYVSGSRTTIFTVPKKINNINVRLVIANVNGIKYEQKEVHPDPKITLGKLVYFSETIHRDFVKNNEEDINTLRVSAFGRNCSLFDKVKTFFEIYT